MIHLAHLQINGLMEDKYVRKTIEKKLATAVKKAGGIAPKFVSPSFAGMPDRLILLPDGKFAFAELKASGESPRPLQKHVTGSFALWAFVCM